LVLSFIYVCFLLFWTIIIIIIIIISILTEVQSVIYCTIKRFRANAGNGWRTVYGK
jgi:hypothetical protein